MQRSIGGASGGFGDYGLGISVDRFGNAYLTGQTTSGGSNPFPTTASAYQTALNSQYGNVFITELGNAQNGSRSLVYSSFLGGSSAIIVGDMGSSIGLDSSGKIYVTGDTTSADFPVTSGAFQTTNSAGGKAFVAAFDPTHSGTQSLVYSTLLGGTNGSQGEVANALAVDSNGDAFVAGSTSSSDFPTTSDAFQTALKNSSWDAFLIELDTTGASLLYSTYFGGSCANGDLGNGVAIDPAGKAHLAGATCSADLPTTAGAYQTTLAGTRNAFVAEIPLPTSAVSIQLTPQNPTLLTGMVQQLSAIATLNNGNSRDLPGRAPWVSPTPSVLTVAPLPQGFALGLGVGTADVTATLGALTASTTVTVVSVPPAPTITSVSRTIGAVGTQVSITGSGFGNVQGSGTVQLGSRPGVVVSWSDTAVVETVATGSVSGTVQVRPSGTPSNSVPFTVITAAITSVSPTSAAAGSQVTITGSGFGSAQGVGQVWLGTAPAQVSSWNDTQVVATVSAGSNSGTAQVLQNGVWSNSVAFTVTGGAPHIASINPNTGSSGTVVTIQGTGFGFSQGSGIAWIGAAQASVNSWSDTQVSATVAASAVSGVAKIQQNGLWSNAVTFTVPSSSSSQLTLNPNVISMVVGDTRSVQALGSNSQPVTGLTWTSSDTTIVTLSTDDPPILTAVTPGNVTITAGGASADVTVYPGLALPPGTVIWSNPGDGSGVAGQFPAVPSASGVDVFAQQNDGSVQAVMSNGAVAWTTPPGNFDLVLPDFQGGYVDWGFNANSVRRLDGITGKPYPAYTSPYNPQYMGLAEPSVHTDGTIFTIEYACAFDACGDALGTPDPTDGAWVVGVDPSTGTSKFKVPTENWTTQLTVDGFCGGFGTSTVNVNSFPGNPMTIAGDGFAYTSYVSKNSIEQRKQSATEPFPVAAYSYFDALQLDTENGNLGAALGDLGSLEQITGLQFSGLRYALENGDQFDAINDVANITPTFRRLCNSTKTVVTKLHILRVGTDGSSSDTIVNQWKDTVARVYAPTPGDTYNYTQVASGPGANVGNVQYIITNADQGAMLSWQLGLGGYCALATDSGCSGGYLASSSEYHLTTTTAGSVASDAIMSPAVAGQYAVLLVLQLQDGSYVGQALSYYLNPALLETEKYNNRPI